MVVAVSADETRCHGPPRRRWWRGWLLTAYNSEHVWWEQLLHWLLLYFETSDLFNSGFYRPHLHPHHFICLHHRGNTHMWWKHSRSLVNWNYFGHIENQSTFTQSIITEYISIAGSTVVQWIRLHWQQEGSRFESLSPGDFIVWHLHVLSGLFGFLLQSKSMVNLWFDDVA